MSYIIQTSELTKAFKGVEVVSQVNMHIKKGEIYGFLGPNGAGKTTVLKLIMNLLKPTAGDISVFDSSLHSKSYEYLKRVGSLIEYPVFYEDLSARENLEIHCEYMGYYKEGAVDEALRLVNLKNIDGKSVKEFSLGMKQRLGIARALIAKPEILILDEPINGLDPLGIKEIRDLLRMLSRDYDITILVSSHILSEIEMIADTVGVINHGRLVEEVPMASVRMEQVHYIELTIDDANRASFIIDNELNVKNFKVLPGNIIRVYDDDISANELSKLLVKHDVEIHGVTTKQQTLEDYFIRLVDGGDISA